MYTGLKAQTRRFWKRKHVQVGGSYDVTHKMIYPPEDVVGTIYVSQVYRQPLGMMTEYDAYREGGYSLPGYMKVLKDITKRDINMQDSPYVVHFTFLLSDIDPNGGNRRLMEYKRIWERHMKKYGKYGRVNGQVRLQD